jgi:uncharacterized membrane protein YdjX (TVP38/TMEM64 family)
MPSDFVLVGFAPASRRALYTDLPTRITVCQQFDSGSYFPSDGYMRPPRAWMFVAVAFSALLVVLAVVEGANVPLLLDPRPSLDAGWVVAASIGVALLVVDAVVPVPSSVVMVALGATFGLVGGVVLSVVGSIGGFALGFLIGRSSGRPIAAALEADDHHRAAQLVRRWGVLAVVVSRPLPLVAETVALSSGAFGMRTMPALLAALAGSAGPAAAYAYAGSKGASTVDAVVVFVLVAVAAGLCWIAGRRLTEPDAPQ